MKINISQKLGLSAALVVGVVGCFAESAEAGRFIYSGSSNKTLDAEFILNTDKGIIEGLTLKKGDIEILSGASTDSVNPSEFTDSDFEELETLLGKDIDPEEFSPAIKYDLTFDTDEFKGTLYIPSKLEGLNIDNPSVSNFDNIFQNNKDQNEEIRIPGLISIQGTAEDFGVVDSGPFTVTKIEKKSTPEPTAAAGLLTVLAVGGLSLHKGDRRLKSKAIIKD